MVMVMVVDDCLISRVVVITRLTDLPALIASAREAGPEHM